MERKLYPDNAFGYVYGDIRLLLHHNNKVKDGDDHDTVDVDLLAFALSSINDLPVFEGKNAPSIAAVKKHLEDHQAAIDSTITRFQVDWKKKAEDKQEIEVYDGKTGRDVGDLPDTGDISVEEPPAPPHSPEGMSASEWRTIFSSNIVCLGNNKLVMNADKNKWISASSIDLSSAKLVEIRKEGRIQFVTVAVGDPEMPWYFFFELHYDGEEKLLGIMIGGMPVPAEVISDIIKFLKTLT